MYDTLRGLPLRFFKLRNFERFAIKEGIADEALKDVVAQMEAGQINANLGGLVYKQRLARPGEGKSGGYRVLLFYRQGERVFFAFGFAKASMANISQKDLTILKEQAKVLMQQPEEALGIMLKNGIIIEI